MKTVCPSLLITVVLFHCTTRAWILRFHVGMRKWFTVPTRLGSSVLPEGPVEVDRRPFVQRVSGPRPARRLNHGFKHLFRHGFNESTPADPKEYLLLRGFTELQVDGMSEQFPPFLSLSVSRQIFPVLEFLRQTLGITEPSKVNFPPHIFGVRLERILAPRHALLVHLRLPHGKRLVDTPSMNGGTLLDEFLVSCRSPQRFAALCRAWNATTVTQLHVKAMDALMSRGLMAVARDEMVQTGNNWPLESVDMTSAQLLHLLVQHGANIEERDHRGASVLHWACGSGNLPVVRSLVDTYGMQPNVVATRDGATPLHWAVAGSTAREFGVGGHIDVCRFLLSRVSDRRAYVNQVTLDGNSPLMWASWSGTLDTVKLMVRQRANTDIANRNGCTVAHWAASGGDLSVCRYLFEIAKVDFSTPNDGGNTPLTHAVAFGHGEVVQWLRNTFECSSDHTAHKLANDFVQWNGTDDRRKSVLALFEEWDMQ